MNIGICAFASSKHGNLDGWLRYHYRLGFDHVLLLDPNPGTPLRAFARAYRTRVTVIGLPAAVSRADACSLVPSHFSRMYDWCAFIDTDEYVVLSHPRFASIQDLLRECGCSGGALALPRLPCDASNGAPVGDGLASYLHSHAWETIPTGVRHIVRVIDLDRFLDLEHPVLKHDRPAAVDIHDCAGKIVREQSAFNALGNAACVCHHAGGSRLPVTRHSAPSPRRPSGAPRARSKRATG